jgi:UDP-4-amino-4,6-dideoxy-N-acetyl-beta-L-altrosamine N-acetyltransferase
MIVGKYVSLRPMDSADREFVRALRNSPQVVRNFQYRHFITDLQQRTFVESLAASSTQMYFIAEDVDEKSPFGVLNFKEIDHRNQVAEWGLFTDEREKGGPVASVEAAVLLLDYGFQYLNLRKVVGEVLADNKRAIRFDEGLGMKLEGVRREHVFYDGAFHDVLLFALFRDDFYNNPTRHVRLLRAGRSAGVSPALSG